MDRVAAVLLTAYIVAGLLVIAVVLGSLVESKLSRRGVYDPPVMQSYEIDMVQLSLSVPESVAAKWKTEVARRFPGAVMVVAHGGEIDGEWYAFPDTPSGPNGDPVKWTTVIERVKAKYPGRFLVLVSCNETHLHLPPSVTGVAYSLQTVWVIPDNQAKTDRTEEPAEIVGNIFEFVVQ